MIHRKRIRALARTSGAAFIGVALAACSVSTSPGPTAQNPDPATRRSDVADPGSVLPEVVITAPRPSSARVAEETSSDRPLRRRGG